MASNVPDNGVLVVGLGRFGTALATTLMDLGHEVLGVDSDAENVQRNADVLTHVVEADATDEDVMQQLGAGEFGRAVVGIGTDLEASILTTSLLVDLQVPDIWAKAITVAHGRILERVGATTSSSPSTTWAGMGRSLADSQVRTRYGITVVRVKPEGGAFTYATPDTVPGPTDLIVVAGETPRGEGVATLG